MSRQLAKYWINAEEYERMGAAGIFPPDSRLELIEGEIFETSLIGSPHAACVDALAHLFHEHARRKYIVRVQNPVRLNDFSEPQPDLALLRWRDDFYRQAHPTPADVLLLVEVADSAVETDRSVKLPLYAKAGVQEVWIVNLPGEVIEIYADVQGVAYQTARTHARGEIARAQTVGGLSVGVTDALGGAPRPN